MSDVARTSEVKPCAECGRENPPGSRFCFCGNSLVEPPRPPPPAGVGGWLLFFCLQLLLLGPLVVGFQLLTDFRAAWSHDGNPAHAGMIAVDAAVRLAMIVLGVVTGVLLVVRARGAVRFTCGYLVAASLAYWLLVALPYLFPLPSEVRSRVVGLFVLRAGLTIPGTIVWLLYFRHSKRVQVTYAPAVEGGVRPEEMCRRTSACSGRTRVSRPVLEPSTGRATRRAADAQRYVDRRVSC